MKRILFVDDEPKVLEGLQRMLRSMRREWEMAFAGGGQEALAALERQQFDVVVSDMRMPGMDGVELLSAIRDQYPHMVRIALSGHAQQELLVRAAGPTHQYLAKPCDAARLKSVIARALGLRDVLANEGLRQAVSQMQTLPSLSRFYSEIMEELQEPDASAKRVGEIISQDIAMTAKLLHLANSAFFGLRRRVSDPVDAVNMLGLGTISALVLSVHIFSEFQDADAGGLRLDRLQQHSIMTGELAKRISETEGCDNQGCDDAFMAGVLHDVGKLVLAANMSARYQESVELARKEHIAQVDAERRVFGTSHAEIGAYLLGLWGLPDPIVEAVMFHHTPSCCQATGFSPTVAVHVADALENKYRIDVFGEEHVPFDTEFLGTLGFADRLPLWQSLSVGDAQKEFAQ